MLQVGDYVPDFILPNVDGTSVRLYAELGRGPVVLVFFTSGENPSCRGHLLGFQETLTSFSAAGAQVLAISPQLPDQSLATQEGSALTFPVLSDVGLNTARAFGIATESPSALLELLARRRLQGADDSGWRAGKDWPRPASFVIRPDHRIVYAGVHAPLTRRSVSLQVLQVVLRLGRTTRAARL